MKRSVFALFLAAVLVVSLTACGGGKESDNSAKSADAAVSEKQESGTQSNLTVSVNAAGEQSTGVSAAGESASPAGSGANGSQNGSISGSTGNAGSASGNSSKPGESVNTGAASGNTSGGNAGGGANSSGSSGSSNHSSGSGSGAKPTDPPAKHTHHFVDVGVQALDWSAAQQDNTGPTNTREQVSAANVCLSCGYFYGNDDDKFAERYVDHILGPNSSKNCTGAYTLVPIFTRVIICWNARAALVSAESLTITNICCISTGPTMRPRSLF